MMPAKEADAAYPAGFPPVPAGAFYQGTMDKEEFKLPCVGCKYNGFKGLVQTCRHPEILEPINGPLMMRLTIAGGCDRFVDMETKIMAGWAKAWPDPVSFAADN